MSKLTPQDLELLKNGEGAKPAPPEPPAPPEGMPPPTEIAPPPEPPAPPLAQIKPGFILLLAPTGMSSVSIEGRPIEINKRREAVVPVTCAKILIHYYGFTKA